jgi:superfamily II DNA or RNA helicase
MYIYVATSPVIGQTSPGMVKLGCTQDPVSRLRTYLTGCPPGASPDCDIYYLSIWQTSAQTIDELYDLEEIVHDKFLKYRCTRRIPGDSEWFKFGGSDDVLRVKSFIESQSWCIREVTISELVPKTRESTFMQKQYHKNLKYTKSQTIRNEKLNQLQGPVISELYNFVQDRTRSAGHFIAPCGSGKTLMTCLGMLGLSRVIICSPAQQIQLQWMKTLVSQHVMDKDNIHYVGGFGTTNKEEISKILENRNYCIITTYKSSNLLADIVNQNVELVVLDEAHHMAGKVANIDSGEGKTRRLLAKCVELNIKRLSLTYTPRIVRGGDEGILSMDNEQIFVPLIAELKIRDLINSGVLPDYRIWSLRDEKRTGMGLLGKAECILEAWDSTEMIRNVELHTLHHLVVFASCTQDAIALEQFFALTTKDTVVLRVEEGDDLDGPLRKFTDAKRAIIVNCYVLGEGVDIPIANSVAIMYPKQSRGQITQMMLRAGRWYEGKSLFHILIPTLGDEDLSAFEEVLYAMASSDDSILDKIVLKSGVKNKEVDNPTSDERTESNTPECIIMEQFEADGDIIKRCFQNIRRNLFPKRIQELCVRRRIDTSIEYEDLRTKMPELPVNPKNGNITWFDYLHPNMVNKLSPKEFVINTLNINSLYSALQYDEWRQTPDIKLRLPSAQHIIDGYFGSDILNFNMLREKYTPKYAGRSR